MAASQSVVSTKEDLPPPTSLSSFQEWLKIPASSSSQSTTTSLSLIRSLDPKPFVEDCWQHSTRPDGRIFAQGRPTKVVFGMLKHSAGSALVQLQHPSSPHRPEAASSASTKILAATTLQIGQPAPDQPDEGDIVVQVTGTGGKNMGSDFKSHQQPHWDVLQPWLQRILEEGGIPSQLNLITGKACIRLVVTVLIIEDGGNLKDASLLACMAAWKDTKLPVVGKDLVEVQGKFWWKQGRSITSQQPPESEADLVETNSESRDFRMSLSMGVWVHPTSTTTHLLVDPSAEEEPFLEGTLTVVISMSTHQLQVDYAGKVALTATDLALAAKLAKGRAEELQTVLVPTR